MVRTIERSEEIDRRVQISVQQVQEWLDQGGGFPLIDVRTPEESAIARLEQAEPPDFQNAAEHLSLPKDRRIAFMCRSGVRSLDVAAFFVGHGREMG